MCIYNNMYLYEFFILLRHKICFKGERIKRTYLFSYFVVSYNPFNPTFEMQNSNGFFKKLKLSTCCLRSNLD